MKRFLVAAVASSLLAGCVHQPVSDYAALVQPATRSSAADRERSIENYFSSANPLVTNGAAFEAVSITLPESVKLVSVPSEAQVQWSSTEDSVQIFLRKDLHFMGHPAAPMSIESVRDQMGVALQIRGSRMNFAFFGDSSSIEGGQHVRGVFVLPRGTKVRRVNPPENRTAEDLKKDGWFVISTHPDPDRHFEKWERPGDGSMKHRSEYSFGQ